MKHLLFSYHTCPVEEPGAGLAGGMNIFLRGLLAGISRRGIETDVLTRGTGNRVGVSRPAPGLRVLHLPCGWRDPPTRAGALSTLPRFIERARGLLAEEGTPYRVVSAHYWMSGAAARALFREPGRSLPFVFVYHTVEAGKGEPPGAVPTGLSAARRTGEEAISREADRIVCFTAEDLSRTERIFPAVFGKGEVIAPGVDDAFRQPPSREEGRRRLGISPGAFLFLLAARPDPGKQLPGAVSAVSSLRRGVRADIQLLVAGQPPPAEGAPEGVRYLGPVPHAEMPPLYAAADAVLCPSLYESFGFVPLEAMASGVPVAVPDSGYWGMRVASGGGGVAYPAGEPGGLARAVGSLYRDGPARRRMAEEGRRIASEFTWERCTESWAALLSSSARPGSRR